MPISENTSAMQPVTVAIADIDRTRRAGCEGLLEGEPGITLLANATPDREAGGYPFENRRLKPRADISASENEVAKIKRLKPLVVSVNLGQGSDEDLALLLSLRHECPDTLVFLLVGDTVKEDQIIQALALGARGYLKHENVPHHLPKAMQAIGRGEIWVSRAMLGNIMDRVLH